MIYVPMAIFSRGNGRRSPSVPSGVGNKGNIRNGREVPGPGVVEVLEPVALA